MNAYDKLLVMQHFHPVDTDKPGCPGAAAKGYGVIIPAGCGVKLPSSSPYIGYRPSAGQLSDFAAVPAISLHAAPTRTIRNRVAL